MSLISVDVFFFFQGESSVFIISVQKYGLSWHKSMDFICWHNGLLLSSVLQLQQWRELAERRCFSSAADRDGGSSK